MEKAAITSSNLPQDRALSEMDEFVYAISHDLRAPLLNFQGFLHRLERASEALRSHVERGDLPIDQRRLAQQILDEKIKPSLEVLEQNARRMDRLLTALLDLSRTGREPVQMQEVNGAEIARAVIEEFRPAAGAKNARLVLEPIPDRWAVRNTYAGYRTTASGFGARTATEFFGRSEKFRRSRRRGKAPA